MSSWCPHLVAAGQMLGMNVNPKQVHIRSLSRLRVRQRPDKFAGKSGKKKPRPGDIRTFSLLPVSQLATEEEIEDMEVEVSSNLLSSASVVAFKNQNIEYTIKNAIQKGITLLEKKKIFHHVILKIGKVLEKLMRFQRK